MVVNLLLLLVLGLVDLYGVLPRGMVVKVVGRTVGRNFGYSKHLLNYQVLSACQSSFSLSQNPSFSLWWMR